MDVTENTVCRLKKSAYERTKKNGGTVTIEFYKVFILQPRLLIAKCGLTTLNEKQL
jgi:hypothetical protein